MTENGESMGEVKTYTAQEIEAILMAHGKWLRGEEGGSRADLRGAYLRGADLSGADLRGAYLRGADLSGAVLPDGVNWSVYLSEVVPALLTAGGRPLAEVATAEHWACHDWGNCPMAAAFGVTDSDAIPPLYRAHAWQFIQLFDAGLIPLPTLPEPATA